MSGARRDVVRQMEAAGVDLFVVGASKLYDHLEELEAFARDAI